MVVVVNGCGSCVSLALSSEFMSQVSSWVRELQDKICNVFENIEREMCSDAAFTAKTWTRDGGGGGEMRLIKGQVFEKGGVNVSEVYGEVTDKMRSVIPNLGNIFWVTGISVVIHTRSPLVPTVHMNTRMFCSDIGYWFGGGADLTPTIVYEEDRIDFHEAMRVACDSYKAGSYEEYKDACDKYFFLEHRQEPRGVGGIFYDYLCGPSLGNDLTFMKNVGEAFVMVYQQIVRRRMFEKWNAEQKHAQLVKRSRYAEFNLIYDRGVKFGLMTGANPETFMMSMPPEAVWL